MDRPTNEEVAMNAGTLNFLLVDDDPIFLAVAEQVIGSLGKHAVSSANDGLAGLEVLKSADHPVDIIILDLNMPRMDGIAFIRAASELGFAGQIIISSGEVEAVRKAAAKIAAMLGVTIAGVLPKPIQIEALATILEQLNTPGSAVAGEEAPRPGHSNLDIVPFYQTSIQRVFGSADRAGSAGASVRFLRQAVRRGNCSW